MKEIINYWKILAILFFLFGAVLFFYSQSQNRQEISKCTQKEKACESLLNQSLIGLKECMSVLGYNFTLNLQEVKK